MANISSAEGYFEFESDFVDKHGDLIQEWIDKHSKSYYGFLLHDSKINDNKVGFFADGRWTYSSTLAEEGLGWIKDDPDHAEENKAIKALTQALADEGSAVIAEFTDYESGCEVLYYSKTLIEYKNATEFEVSDLEYKLPDYNLRNIVNAGVECLGYDFKDKGDIDDFYKFAKLEYSLDKKICDKIVEDALNSKYRDGIILDYEVEDLDTLKFITDGLYESAKVLKGR